MPKENLNNILIRIEALRGRHSLAAFCQEVGLNYETTKKCFQRNGLPDSESLAKIAQHFQADLQWLIDGPEPASPLNKKIGRKIRQARELRGWTPGEMGARLGLTPVVVELYEQGQCRIHTDMLQAFSHALALHPSELITDEGPLLHTRPQLKIFQTASIHKTPQIQGQDYVSVPLTESAIAAGQPIIPQENIEDYVLLHIRAAGKHSNLVASRVDGNSMEPTLHSGDIVVIDRDDKIIIKNKMFAIYHEGGLTAKFLERKDNLLILRPLNPSAEIQIIDLNENPQPIVGKIIGAWKDL